MRWLILNAEICQLIHQIKANRSTLSAERCIENKPETIQIQLVPLILTHQLLQVKIGQCQPPNQVHERQCASACHKGDMRASGRNFESLAKRPHDLKHFFRRHQLSHRPTQRIISLTNNTPPQGVSTLTTL